MVCVTFPQMDTEGRHMASGDRGESGDHRLAGQGINDITSAEGSMLDVDSVLYSREKGVATADTTGSVGDETRLAKDAKLLEMTSSACRTGRGMHRRQCLHSGNMPAVSQKISCKSFACQ